MTWLLCFLIMKEGILILLTPMHYFLKGGFLKEKVTSNLSSALTVESLVTPKIVASRSWPNNHLKDHANLVGTVSSEDEDDADTSTPIHALTAHIRDLSLDEEVYAPDDLDLAF